MTELDPVKTKQKILRGSRKKRKSPSSESPSSEEEWFSSDENIEDSTAEDDEEQHLTSGPWTYDLDIMLLKEEFEIKDVCREMNASDFTIEYLRENGLEEPLLFKDSLSTLGMKMPEDGTLTARCVLKAVGDRQVEVVDVMTQGSRQMMLSDFVNYYESPPVERKELLNLLSLEFSLTSLSKKVRGPALALEIDWVELYWPKHLQNSSSTFPKVQNYCLMSVKRSFTDFHIDFGGTSVWYHVYKGRKIFWIIEPTEENILKYERWILEGSQHEVFFGDLVDKCARIELYEGYTFIIPSGWIHAVYTPEDSLVFGGNFLHSFSIPMQLRIICSENILMIREKYRYPNYVGMVWYVIENIVQKATGCINKINKTGENVSGRNDQEVDSSALKEEVPNADDIIIHVDCLAENFTKNADMEKEADSDFINVNSTSTQVKDSTVGSSTIKAKSEETVLQENTLAYNDEYLSTISKKEREGFKSLLVYMREIVSDHKDLVDQAKIHLLNIFEQILDYKVPEHFIIEKERGKIVEQRTSPKFNQWLKAFGKNKPPTTKRKISPKEKATEMQQFARCKPSKSKVKSNKKPDYHKPDGPLIVGGIPPAIMPADAPQAPNPYGYDPLASVTPLGHKQLPSAYRRTPDMAKAPPSQKFRLQPQLYKVVAGTSDQTEATPVKPSDKSSSTNATSVLGSSNDNNSAEYESKTATVAQADTERTFYHNESARSYHNRSKDNQHENRHIVKEEYPELQYRSPLMRPGPSNRGTNVTSEHGHNSYRYQNKAYKRRYSDLSSTADCWSRRSGTRLVSDRYSKKSKYSTSWRPEMRYKSDTAEISGCSRHSPTAKVATVKEKDHEREKNIPMVQPIRVIEKQSLVGVVGSSQYVSLLNRERNPASASVRDGDNSMQYGPRREHGAVASSIPLPKKCSVLPSEFHGSTVVKPVKKSAEEIEKPQIRDLSVTLNDDNEDSAEIMTATEELAELTKVFDVDERDSEKKGTGHLMVTGEQKKLEQHSWSSLKKADDLEQRHSSSPEENLKIDSVSSSPKLPKIPTETVLQNLSSLTAEFNAVVD